jgi:hypothetical protein
MERWPQPWTGLAVAASSPKESLRSPPPIDVRQKIASTKDHCCRERSKTRRAHVV